METLVFYIVNVFAEEKFTGNHLAVVLHVRRLSDTVLQQIAREIGPAAFILSDQQNKGGYRVRIFTPNQELAFSGHPVLGAAYIIQKEILRAPVRTVELHLPAGPVQVALFYDEQEMVDHLSMQQQEATFGRTFERGEIAALCHLSSVDIDDRYPIQEVSTGLPFIIVPLKTLEAIRRAKIVEGLYHDLIQHTDAKALLLFCPETYNPWHHFHVRVFAGYYGVPEDPGTGSANGAFAAYLVKHRYLGQAQIAGIQVEQGYLMERPSLLRLEAIEREGRITVAVGGRVIMVARGVLF
ncbi:MAG: PhzF family phenazine biosynthesis protein [Nitrospinota bacterium]|nr:MAG: PhzF family phenazine biosynthesis protein [Nitrospinota bacterium]